MKNIKLAFYLWSIYQLASIFKLNVASMELAHVLWEARNLDFQRSGFLLILYFRIKNCGRNLWDYDRF